MLAEAAQDRVKVPPAQRAAAQRRGLLERVKGWVLFTAVDGRGEKRARLNAPFEPRDRRGVVLLALIPGVLLLLATGAIFLRPLTAEPDALATIPVAVPAQTEVERKLIGKIVLLRDGLWEARLPPWSAVPFKGMARVSNPEVHAALDTLLGEITAFGAAIGNRAPPGIHRDRVFLGQVADFRARLHAIEVKLGGVRSVTAYHLGLLALWAGDAADAEPQFAGALAVARSAQPLDDAGRQRLDGIEASAAYGLGLAEAARGAWQNAIGDFDAALTASCRAAALGKTQADFGFALGPANLVPLDTSSVRNDRLVALIGARNSGDGAARGAIVSPTCRQLLSPSKAAPRGDADAEARALFSSLSVADDPILAANLQLRAALMGERDVVQRLAFDGADAEAMQAQALARAVAGLEAADGGVDKSALADLQKLGILKSKLAADLGNGALVEPESDPAWSWSDPTLFMAWKNAVARVLAAELLGRADEVRDGNPGLAVALYDVVLDNRGWLSDADVFDAWWRLNTGTSLAFVLAMLGVAAALTIILLLALRRWRQTYRTTFESHHHDDRVRAPEG
ncbi:MAG: hypothetical protein WDN08_07230 [Rhizomicrobium sp.]